MGRGRINESKSGNPRNSMFCSSPRYSYLLTQSSLTSFQVQIAKVLESPYLHGNTSVLFVFHDRKDLGRPYLNSELISSGPIGVRRYLVDAFRLLQDDARSFLSLLGRKQELKQGFEKIINSKFHFDPSQQTLDFQTCLLPLLFVLSHPGIEGSPLLTEVNYLYSLAKMALSSLFSDYLTCMVRALSLKTLQPPTLNLSTLNSSFFPFSFAQGFYPMVKFLEILFRRFHECARDTVNQKNVDQFEELLFKWKGAFECGHLTNTKESKMALDTVFCEFQRVKSLLQSTVDVTERLNFLRNRERKAMQEDFDDVWKDAPLLPPRQRFDNDHVNYRDIQLIPTMEEILFDGEICLPGNLPFSPSAHWLEPGPERLLDTQFRLLRMDMVAKVRLNVQVFIEHLKKGKGIRCGRFKKHLGYQQSDFMVYTNVTVKQPSFNKFYGLCHDIQFDLPHISRESIPRFNENQLQKDGLVCFIYKDSTSVYSVQVHFAIIASRDKECFSNPYALLSSLSVSFPDSNFEPSFLRFGEIYLLEFQGLLFESYRPILRALQKLDHLDIPFLPILCPSTPPNPQTTVVELPKYLKNQNIKYSFTFLNKAIKKEVTKSSLAELPTPVRILGAFCPLNDNVTVYSTYLASNTSLDKSQAKSLLGALTNNVCCIQGPPGTGKTFIGVQIIKSLLQLSMKSLRILVMSLTNHALDQFLSHLSNEGIQNMIRISTVKNEELARYDCISKTDEYELSKELRICRDTLMKLQMKIASLKQNIKTPVRELEIWNYLKENETGIVKELEWPFRFPDEMSMDRKLAHWRRFKDPILEKEKKKAKKAKKPRKSKSKSDSLTFSLGRSEDFLKSISIEQIMEDFNRGGMLDADEPLESNIVDESNFENSQTTSNHVYHTTTLNHNFTSDENDWKKIESSLRENPEEFFDVLQILKEPFSSDKETKDKNLANLVLPESNDIKSMWELELDERENLYTSWSEMVMITRKRHITTLQQSFTQLIAKYQELLAANMHFKLLGTQIVGITTTRASKHIEALKAWGPTVILCEEAGEILEAHVLASLSTSVKHLILIGDHKQLRPRISEYDLSVESQKGKQYRLDVSLFERLMDPKCHLPLYTLQEQRRMKPIISQFIRETIYSELSDGDNVMGRSSIRGMQKDVFFMTHSHPQTSSEEIFGSLGHSNLFEVEMIVATVKYLLKLEYFPNQIVVLTPYLAQLRLLRRELSKLQENHIFLTTKRKGDTYPSNEKNLVRVSSVDNFQGEEADIILISLVRSTLQDGVDYGIGFLKIENRVNVLLSRARCGMYLFGNSELLSKCSKMWRTIFTLMEKQDLIGNKLPIVCPNHPDQKRSIEKVKEFEVLSPLGGCLEMCTFRLKCGHVCIQPCHIQDSEHTTYKCMKACETRYSECDHRCNKKCHEPCGECQTIVDDITLPCGHTLKSPKCYIRLKSDKIQCNKMVKHDRCCGHVTMIPCYKDRDAFLKVHPCREKNSHERACGHGSILIPCNEDIDSFLKAHPCKEKVTHNRPCGHGSVDIPCHEDLNAYLNSHQCMEVTAQVILSACKHTYYPICYELKDLKSIKCKEKVTCIRNCGHTVSFECSQNADKAECTSKCGKTLPCNHSCAGKCGKCDCNLALEGGNFCNKKCSKLLPCFHKCLNLCKDHSSKTSCPENCSQACLKTACSHQTCNKGCSDMCEPCLAPCTWSCEHQGTCPYPCGYPCIRLPCDERCNKILKCGHPCPSVCGEECPSSKYCLDCTRKVKELEEVQETLLKHYSSSLASQPILVLKCGHFFPMFTLDDCFHLDKYYEKDFTQWISFKYPQQVQSTFLACPNCKYPVCERDIHRYSRIIKIHLINKAGEVHISRFSSNLVHASTILLDLEKKKCLIQSSEIQNIRNLLEKLANQIFNSNSNELANNIMDSSLVESFPNIPAYQILFNFSQYATLYGEYFVLRARLEHMKKKACGDARQLLQFKQMRLYMEESQNLYDAADEYFYQSYAGTRQIQLHVERIYAELDYYTTFLQFVIFGEFRTLDSGIRILELKSAIDRTHILFYDLSQMPRTLQKWNMLYLHRFIKKYIFQLYKLAKILECILEFLKNQQNRSWKDVMNSVKCFIAEFENLPKFQMAFCSQNVKFGTNTYVWQICIEGHFYPVSFDHLKKVKNNRCEECGLPIVEL